MENNEVVANEGYQKIEVDFNNEMLQEDKGLQETGTEQDLVQDTFNEDGIENLVEEGTVIENVSSEE